jgi:hypothetical protein
MAVHDTRGICRCGAVFPGVGYAAAKQLLLPTVLYLGQFAPLICNPASMLAATHLLLSCNCLGPSRAACSVSLCLRLRQRKVPGAARKQSKSAGQHRHDMLLLPLLLEACNCSSCSMITAATNCHPI